MSFTTHETAIVDAGAVIGTGSRLWHWVHVCAGARIGADCSLGQGVYVGGAARLGNRVKVQNHVSIYDAVTLEDDVFCGPGVVFTNVLNPRSAVVHKAHYRPTLVRRGATLGANCTLVCGVTIGEYAFIGAGAVVTHDIKPYALVLGVPARPVGWVSAHGERLDLPGELPAGESAQACCPVTGARYLLRGDSVQQVDDDGAVDGSR
jgi:UDP-2-acetamido-3-amino-2,3-dideoxy-glucuronate N-acetyltransferase